MDQKIITLYDRFTHGGMSRRDFLDRLAELAGSAAAATALLPILQNDYAKAAIVPPDDGRLVAERVSYESPKGKINGYLVRAKATGKRPTVIAIHEMQRRPVGLGEADTVLNGNHLVQPTVDDGGRTVQDPLPQLGQSFHVQRGSHQEHTSGMQKRGRCYCNVTAHARADQHQVARQLLA